MLSIFGPFFHLLLSFNYMFTHRYRLYSRCEHLVIIEQYRTEFATTANYLHNSCTFVIENSVVVYTNLLNMLSLRLH